MKCKYCGEKMLLERFIHRDYEKGDFIQERFIYTCNSCSIIISPKFVLLDQCETDKERALLRDLFLSERPKEKKEVRIDEF